MQILLILYTNVGELSNGVGWRRDRIIIHSTILSDPQYFILTLQLRTDTISSQCGWDRIQRCLSLSVVMGLGEWKLKVVGAIDGCFLLLDS